MKHQYFEHSSQNSAYEEIEHERQRSQNQESYLSQDVLRRDSLFTKGGSFAEAT